MLNVKDIDEVKAFLELARDRFEFGRKADQEDREIAEDDNRFAYADDKNLDQWDALAKKSRKKQKLPILQWNRIPTYVQQVANDGRQNRPSIKINPSDDAASLITARHYTDRIRQIEYESNADTAKDTARDQQITSARGFMRVSTEWIPGTQQQRIKIDRIDNQFSVIWDPAARNYDRSDADWCIIISHISQPEHIRRYGKQSIVSQMDFAHIDNELANWVGVGKTGEMIQIAEYWVKEYEDRIVPGSDGQPARKEKAAKICQYVINGAEILSDTEWLGSTIPIVPVWGKEAIIDGKRRTFSLVRNAKEPSRFLNLALSNLSTQMGQQAKTPWLVPQGGIAANHENDWANIHVTPLGYVVYQTRDEDNNEIPAPVRNNWEPPIQALVECINLCIDAVKASMGIFDASMGAKSNETSGIAIQRRQKESDVTNYHFPDNEARSNKYLGEILVELIPILDRPGSMVPIRTEDGKTHVVPVGQAHEDWKTGEVVTHDLLSGQYGVTVSTGPSYTTQRQEAFDRDAAMIQAQPELMFVIGDQMFANDDTAGAEERADRLKRYIAMKTPGLIEDKQNQPDPQAMQQQLMQAQQEIQKVHAFANSLHEQIQAKVPELQNAIKLKQMDLEFQREKLAIDDQNKKLDIASKESIEQLEHDIAILMDERQKAHELQQQQAAQQHEADQALQGQQADAASQEQAQEHQTGLQDQAQAHAAEQSDADRAAAAEQAKSASEAAD